MLRGRVDAITRQRVMGWAADDEKPDQIEWVCIFVDGHKVADVECSVLRGDLRKLGTFGSGNHGFRFTFPQPLADDAEQRVTVRFSTTGKRLPNGEMLLRSDGSATPVVRTTNRLIAEPEPLPAPRNPRGLFEILGLLDDKRDVHDLLCRISFGDMDRDAVRAAVFGDMAAQRTPDEASPARYSAWEDIDDQLRTERFRANVIPLFLRAYPEKKRLIFVHVPKCAGTDLAAKLMGRLPFLHEQMMYTDWLKPDELLYALSRVVQNGRFFDELLVTGHISLQYYITHQLIRPIDRVVTILRDPVEIAVSNVNYVITRLLTDARAGRFLPDTRSWLNHLKFPSLTDALSEPMRPTLCHQILHNRQIVRPNLIRHWLGGNSARAAYENLINNNVEVTTTERYNDWLRESWGITSATRLNRSEKFTSIAAMSPQDVAYIHDSFVEDIALYRMVAGALGRTDRASIMGRDLA